MKEYDYTAPGAYFVTIVAQERLCLFGEIVDGHLSLSIAGDIVREEWMRSQGVRREVRMDAFVVMPNHIHGVVWLVDNTGQSIVEAERTDVGAHGRAPLRDATRPPSYLGHAPLLDTPRRSARSLGSFVAGFKAATTTRINRCRNMLGTPVWQRNYYEHVIRDETELLRIRQYIADNPLRWESDRENPLARVTLASRRGGDEPWQV